MLQDVSLLRKVLHFILKFWRKTWQYIFFKLSVQPEFCEGYIPLKAQQDVWLTIELILNSSGYLFL